MIFLLVLIVSVVSCTDSDGLTNEMTNETVNVEFSNEEMLSIKDDILSPLSEEDILSIVSNYNPLNLKTSTKSKLSISGKYYQTFKSSSRTKSANNEPDSLVIYNVTMETEEGKGFSLVSADKRVPGILVHIPNGDINDTIEYKGFTTMLDLSHTIIKANAIYYNHLVDSLKESTITKICDAENITREKYNENIEYYVNKYNDVKYIQKETKVTEGDYYQYISQNYPPALKTAWGQGYPYNAKVNYSCPGKASSSITNTEYKDKAAAGCVPIAAGQIIAHFRKYYLCDNWEYITYNYDAFMKYKKVPADDPAAVDAVSTFIADLGTQFDVWYNREGEYNFPLSIYSGGI